MKVGFLAYSAGARGEFVAMARFLEARGHSGFLIVPEGVHVDARSTAYRAARSDAGTLRNAARLWRMRRDVDALVAREAPDVVVVNRDRGNDVVACVLHAARRAHVPVAALDVGLTSARFKARTRTQATYDARRGLNRVAVRVWPEQVRNVDGRAVLFHPAGKTAALAALSMLPPRPWLNGENGAAVHLMQSDASVAAARAEGAHANNVVVVGLPSLDALHDALRARDEIRAELGHEDGGQRRVCVFALPQLVEQKMASLDEALADFTRVIDAVLSVRDDVLVVASLHPSMERVRYAALDRNERWRGRFRIANAPLSRVMAAADVSIHGFPTTTTWSLLVGAPALFLDWWQQGYEGRDLGAHARGVRVSTDRARIRDDVAAALSGCVPPDASLTPFDGRCRQRIMDALLELASLRRSCAP